MQVVKSLFLVIAALSVMTACKSEAASNPQAPTATVAAAPDKPKTPLEEAGIPVYPGSKKVSITVSKPAQNGTKRVAAEYSSVDSTDKVSAFYQQKLGLMQGGMGKFIQLVGKLPNGMFTQILIEPKNGGSKIQYYVILAPKK